MTACDAHRRAVGRHSGAGGRRARAEFISTRRGIAPANYGS